MIPGRRRRAGWAVGFAACLAGLLGQTVSPAEAFDPPSATTIERLVGEARAGAGWPAVEESAWQATGEAMARGRLAAAEQWLLVSRWARLWGEDQRELTDRWVAAINSARLGHANMRVPASVPDSNLSAVVSQETAVALMANAEFSRSFFELLTPYDYLPSVLATIEQLRPQAGPQFDRLGQLILAIALVYDVPPPPGWPHGQVSAAQLPRRLPAAGEALAYWRDLYDGRRALVRLAELKAAELKFVVDVVATGPELGWARDQIDVGLDQLDQTYAAVRYRDDRLAAGLMNWPGSTYVLPEILSTGGICVDQAYFASTAAKARGVPSLIFLGAGLDGRHAWFGYRDNSRRWRLDAGRYEDQRYVVGIARDPQTWREFNDHELQFLAEGFRRLPPYESSRTRMWLAQEYLRRGEEKVAAAEARRAIHHERRNVGAWEAALAVMEADGSDLRTREALLRDAARAFQRYPDLNRRFMKAVIATLRERGEGSAADNEARLLARKYQNERSDLSVSEAAETMARSLADDTTLGQRRVFQRLLLTYGADGGMDFLDQVIRPAVVGWIARGESGLAVSALADARLHLRIASGSQLDEELNALERRARTK